MSKKVDLACTVCTEEFLVPIGVYNAHSSVIPCPCCGSTDLVLLGEVAGTGAHDSGLPLDARGLEWRVVASGFTDLAVRDCDGDGI